MTRVCQSLMAPTKVRDHGHDGAWPSRKLRRTTFLFVEGRAPSRPLRLLSVSSKLGNRPTTFPKPAEKLKERRRNRKTIRSRLPDFLIQTISFFRLWSSPRYRVLTNAATSNPPGEASSRAVPCAAPPEASPYHPRWMHLLSPKAWKSSRWPLPNVKLSTEIRGTYSAGSRFAGWSRCSCSSPWQKSSTR